jgi:G:T-mismatch repair DNA endonuclease (very short patch repair protein)
MPAKAASAQQKRWKLRGYRYSEEGKKRLNRAHVGRKQSPEQIAKRLAWRDDPEKKAAAYAKRSKKMKGRKASAKAVANRTAWNADKEKRARTNAKIKATHGTKETRSRMALSQSKSVRSYQPTGIERKVHRVLHKSGIEYVVHKSFITTYRGQAIWQKPDIYIPSLDLVVEVYGCYWHDCLRCTHPPCPVPNARKRDTLRRRLLRQHVGRVVVIWEHEIKKDVHKAVVRALNC